MNENDLIVGVIGTAIIVVTVALGVFLGLSDRRDACRRTCYPWRVVDCGKSDVECERPDGTRELLLIVPEALPSCERSASGLR